MWNWVCFSEKGEIKFLLKDIDRSICRYGIMAYESIQDDLIDTFGISQDYKKILETKVRIERMYAKMYVNNDRSLKLLITQEERELELMERPKTTTDMYESLLQIEKLQGVRYPVKEITVYDYYKLAKLVSKKSA